MTTGTKVRPPERHVARHAPTSRVRSIRFPERVLSVPVARYGSPDDQNYPDDDPTVYANYGGGGYDEPPGPPPGDEVPWFRKPAALVGFGALGAIILALIVFGLAKLITGDGDEPSEQTTLTPLTTTSRSVTPTTTTSAPGTVTVTETPTTTTTTEPTTTTTTTTPPTTTTTTTTTTPSVSTSISTSTETSTVTETVTPDAP